MIDEWIRNNTKNEFDNNGNIAKRGKIDELILNQALENFNIGPPYKDSLDIKDFDISFAKGLSLEDGTSTLADFTSSQISKALKYFKDPEKNTIFLVCGGGRKNIHLIESIKKYFSDNCRISIDLIDQFTYDGDFIESQAFGY